MHPSDPSSQYTHYSVEERVPDTAVQGASSESGDVRDLAAKKSFLSSFRTERAGGMKYRTRETRQEDFFD
jgi:hypothetical protein